MDQRSDSSSASTSPVNTSVANLKTADCTPHAGLAMIRSNTSGLKKEKNTKKLSLSTAAAQKLGPMIQISDQLQNHPKTATPLSRRKPMKLPSLNIGLVRRPSLPLMAGKIPPPTPIDRTFSVVRELQSDGTPDLLKESSSTNAYTSGPVCVLSPNLWLYSEPTAQELRHFDVVINVAKEIVNPLLSKDDLNRRLPRVHEWHEPPDMINQSSPDSSESSPRENWTRQMDNPVETRSLLTSTKHDGIEYVHMPWDHNQALEKDLPLLTAFIDKRINLTQKRVLIHCQQGVSRSASLVIAYIMKSQSLDVNEAYTYVKGKSANIGPNMSLIYQLCEWGKTLQRANSVQPQRRSFEVSGAKTVSGLPSHDFEAQQRKRANSTADRAPLGRTKSEVSVSTRNAFNGLTISTDDEGIR